MVIGNRSTPATKDEVVEAAAGVKAVCWSCGRSRCGKKPAAGVSVKLTTVEGAHREQQRNIWSASLWQSTVGFHWTQEDDGGDNCGG